MLEVLIEKIKNLSDWEKLISWFCSMALTFLIPLAPYLAAVSALVMVDLFTGIRAANKRKEDIRSKGLLRSLLKIRDYFIAILLTEMMSRVFFGGIPITYITASYVGVIEFKSNLENIAETTGTDLWKKIRDYLPNKLKNDSTGTKDNAEETERKDNGRSEPGESSADNETES